MTAPAPNNLPLQLSSFIGRAREMAEVKQLLDPHPDPPPRTGEDARLVTLTGAGGCGKTRLALQVSADLCRDVPAERLYADGIWFVEFASLVDPSLVAQRVATTLDVREQPGQPILTTLTNYLRDKYLLLVLDNCEHLIEACAQLANTLLRACPYLQILATSREPLNLAGEHIYLVPSLGIPNWHPERVEGPKDQLPIATLEQTESVRLFVERATAVHAQFRLTDRNANAIAQICYRLDGIPLSIELAAARVPSLAVEEIAVRLDNSLRLLTSGARTAVPRHQTLRATMDWSYDLLSEVEQVLLRRLSVFRGGWKLDAAEVICSGRGLDRRDALDVLTRLVTKSLVSIEERNGARYRMLETVQQFAQERLQASGDTERLRQNHLAYFLKLAEEAEPYLTSAERQIWLERLDAELDNLRAALEWTGTMADQQSGLRLAGALSWFWWHGNYVSEGRRWLERTLTTRPGRYPTATFPSERAYRAKALLSAANLDWGVGDFRRTRAQFEESLALFKEIGDQRGIARVLASFGGKMCDDATEDVRARPFLEESVTILRALVREDQVVMDSQPNKAETATMRSVDQWWLAFALNFLGDVIHHNDLADARPILEEGLVLARHIGDKWLMARMLVILGDVAMRQGDLTSARARLEQSLVLFRQMGAKITIAWALGALGDVARYEADYRQAAQFYAESLSLYREVGYRDGIAWMLCCVGSVALHDGECARAAELFAESLVLRNEIRNIEGMAEALDGLAGVAAVTQQPERAARLFGAAEVLRETIHGSIRPQHREPYERYLPMARAQLDEATFNTAWAEGRAMTLEQAIAEAERIAIAQPAIQPPTYPTTYPASLTAREVEVLRWLVQGLSDREIADQLVISVRTVHGHLRAIYSKLDVTSRAAAIHVALEHKIV